MVSIRRCCFTLSSNIHEPQYAGNGDCFPASHADVSPARP
jgi:hypothetical protein